MSWAGGDRWASDPQTLVELADPGPGGTIDPTLANGAHIHLPLSSAGAETRTLNAPTRVGQEMTLTVDSFGGQIDITATAPLDGAGNDILNMLAARATIKLIGILQAAALKWQHTGDGYQTSVSAA